MAEHAFQKLAPKLFKLGYEPVPIAPGSKAIYDDNWSTIEINHAQIADWGTNRANHGVGIRTKFTPAIDIDVLDPVLAQQCEALAEIKLDSRLTRVGRAPKRLLVFRTDKPFRKVVLKLIDPKGGQHKIEVLGEGQQFVAYGIHPDTQKPYAWTSMDDLYEVKRSALPELTAEGVDNYFDAVERAAKALGWSVVPRNRQLAMLATEASDDALLSYQPVATNVTLKSIKEMLALIENAEDYEHWLAVGMALHHQFSGTDEKADALSLWHEWSEKANNYDAEAVDHKWDSFGFTNNRSTTVRYILKLGNEALAEKKRERLAEMLTEVRQCQASQLLYTKLATRLGKQIDSDVELDILVDAIVERGKDLDKKAPRKETIRKVVKQALASTRVNHDCPDWCANWIYVSSAERFYNVVSHVELSERAFNASFNRKLLSMADKEQGQFIPEYPASVIALNQHALKVVERFGYMPGVESTYTIDSVSYANIYDERGIPEMPDKYTDADKLAIKRVERHLALLLEKPEEQRMLMDFLAYHVQEPSKRCNYAVLLQGAEGIGKSFFSELMAGVLGYTNIGIVSPGAIIDKYTHWGEGRRFNVIEEIKLRGENSYATLDKLKPYITNSIVPIRMMQRGEYNVPNVVAYLLLTNHLDALPLTKGDTRYLVLMSWLQTKAQVDAFVEENPNYFGDLFESMRLCKGALRKWLMHWTFSPDFDPNRRAPSTEAKQLMIQAAAHDDNDDTEEVIATANDPLVGPLLLSVARLKECFAEQGKLLPRVKLSTVLTQLSYQFVGRARGPDGKQARFWTKFPARAKPLQELIDALTADDSIFD